MNGLMTKLEYIQDQCQDPKKKREKADAEKQWDDFTKLRKKLARDIKSIREQIHERNELMGKDEVKNPVTVKKSQEIRNALKVAIKEAEDLEAMQKKEEVRIEERKLTNKKVKPEEEEEVQKRTEVVLLCKQHIEECRRLEKTTKTNAQAVLFDSSTDSKDPLISELPEIDGDEGFQLLRHQDQEIDVRLGKLSDAVGVVKEMALEMGKEVEMQDIMIGELTKKVQTTNDKLINLNKRLKKTIEGVRKADRFCLDFILLVVILAIGGYLYNVFRKF